MEAYLGQIMSCAFKFAPAGWMVCDGSLLLISQNPTLFALLGTKYGGDGVTTFGIPDLRGRVPVHQGQRAGGSDYVVGQAGGQESVELLRSHSAHTHTLMAAEIPKDTPPSPDPGPTMALTTNTLTKVAVYAEGPANVNLDYGSMWNYGDGQPHENRQPFLVINHVICISGIYPRQS